ncbi:MAG: hypothetical protein GYB18_02040 [Oceanospirillales bacterium]|nr:hypothetical protein [Oceanospirillales bacterium]
MSDEIGYLDAEKLHEKVESVTKRVGGRGLKDIAEVLSGHIAAIESVKSKHKMLDQLRILLNGIILFGASYAVWLVYTSSHEIVKPFSFPASVIDVLTGFDSLANVGIFLFLSLLIISRLIDNYKHSDCLKRLDHLHQLIHVLDMHQVAKETISLGFNDKDTEEIPISERYTASKEYLDRLHELVVLAGKTAAIYPQICDEHVVIAKVQGVEELSLGISTKLWQRYDRLERYYQANAEKEATTEFHTEAKSLRQKENRITIG